VAGYRLTIKPSAAKEIQAISDNTTLALLIKRIKSLSGQPRPSGSEKLASKSSLYRVRQSSYRSIYSVDDQTRVVDVIEVGLRRDVYR